MPPQVGLAAILTLLLAVGADIVSVPLCVTGPFSGPQVLVPGLICALLGVIMSVAWRGVLHRRRWARWVLVAVSAVVTVTMPIFVARECLQAMKVDGALFFMIFPILFATILLNLLSRPAGKWFEG